MSVFYPLFALLFGFLSILTNGLSFLVFYRNLSLTFGSPIIYYFVTLTCMYFVKGIVTICWALAALFKSSDQQLFFTIARCVFWATALSLFLTLLAMVIERHISTCSLQRLEWLRARKRVYTYFCLMIVVFSLICGQLVALQRTGLYMEFVICIIAEVAFIVTLIIFARFWLKQREREQEASEIARREARTRINKCQSQFDCHKRLNIIVLCYIVGTLVTVLPFFVAFQAKLVYNLFFNEPDSHGHLKTLLEVYPVFTCLNYGLTPLFYLCALPKFKRCLFLLLSCQNVGKTTVDGRSITQESEETTSFADLV